MARPSASRIVRQTDRRLAILGVVHTHPGSLRHPSDGDYRGDSQWVGQLRGGEGIFGIGTADARCRQRRPGVARQPRPHVQCLGKLCFRGMRCGAASSRYRPLPVEMTLGPDLARPLHSVWATIEAHAERLDRLARQQAGVRFEVFRVTMARPWRLPFPWPSRAMPSASSWREKEVRYYLVREDELLEPIPTKTAWTRAFTCCSRNWRPR